MSIVAMNMGKDGFLFQFFALALLCAAAFHPVLYNGILNWDDGAYLAGNAAVHSLSLSNTLGYFSGFVMGHYHPLTLQAYAFQYALFGESWRWWHMTSLLLHIGACGFALAVFRLLLPGATRAAFCAALLFALSPLRVEPVAWLAAQKELWCGLFYFASLYFYLRGGKRGLWLSFAAFLAALLSKSMAVTLPLVLLLLDWRAGRREWRAAIVEKIPFFALALAAGLLALGAQRSSASYVIPGTAAFSLVEKIAVSNQAFWFYLGRFFIPSGLSPLYPYMSAQPYVGSVFLWLVPPAFVCLLWLARMRKTIQSGLLFFVLTLAPVMPLFLKGWTLISDKYSYIPSFGLALAVTAALAGLEGRILRRAAFAALLCACGVFLFVSRAQSRQWKDSVTLWGGSIREYPGLQMAYIMRGNALLSSGKTEPALADYSRALALEDNALAHFTLGAAYSAKDDRNTAMAEYDRALELNPSYAEAWRGKGLLQLSAGDFSSAEESLGRAIALSPKMALAYYGRAVSFIGRNMPVRALPDLDAALRLNPCYGDALAARGGVRLSTGDCEGARRDLASALAERGKDGDLLFQLGLASACSGRCADALSSIRESIGIKDTPQKREGLSRVAASCR